MEPQSTESLVLESLIEDGLVPSPMTAEQREHAEMCIHRALLPLVGVVAERDKYHRDAQDLEHRLRRVIAVAMGNG